MTQSLFLSRCERQTRHRNLASQRGYLLIEVLVSFLVIGIGVLGLIGMQGQAVSSQRDSFDRKAAAELMAQIDERMRANHLGFMANAYTSQMLPDSTPTTSIDCLAGAPCTPTNLARNDLAAWQTAIRQRLVDGGAVIAPIGAAGATIGSGASSVLVTMIWREAKSTTGTDARCTAVGVADPAFRCLTAAIFP